MFSQNSERTRRSGYISDPYYTNDPVKCNADLGRDAEQVHYVNIRISLTISLILASLNWPGNSVTVALRLLIVSTSNEVGCSLAAYSYHSPEKIKTAAWERPFSLPHCLGPRALGRLLRHPHVLDAESVNAHVPVGISAVAATAKQKPYVGYKANMLLAQARINAFL